MGDGCGTWHAQALRYDEALEDADKAIGIDATFAKAFWRRGEALSALKRYPEALRVRTTLLSAIRMPTIDARYCNRPLHAQLAPGGVQGWRACPHAQPGLPTYRQGKAAPLAYSTRARPGLIVVHASNRTSNSSR